MYEKKLSHLIKRDGSVKDFDANKIVAAIAKAGGSTKTASTMILADCDVEEAEKRLEKAGGRVREAIS